MDEILKKETLEGVQTDGLEGTSTSSDDVELNNSPVPTPEEIEDADMVNASDEENVVTETVEESSESDINAPIEDEVATAAAAPEEEIPSAEKLFTQSQVNDLVGKTRMETREQTYKAIYGRYGVNDEAGMDELVGNAQRYETLHDEYDSAKKNWETSDLARTSELAEVKEHVALLESGIDRNRFDDAKAIIKSKGLEVTTENIQNELATHPEWKGNSTPMESVNPNFHKDPNAIPQETPSPKSTIQVLGNEGSSDTNSGMSEEEFAMKKLFKV